MYHVKVYDYRAKHGKVHASLFSWGDRLKHYLILCRSATSAQRCARVLEASLIRASVTKAPRGLSRSGCAYAISLYNKLESAIAVLLKNNLNFGKVFFAGEDGEWREVPV